MTVEQNGTVWANGQLRGWAEVSVPLMSDAVIRAAAVFDGIRADTRPGGSIRLLSGEAHAMRLLRSARVLEIPVDYQIDDILEASATVARAELSATGKHVAYIRPMALAASITAGTNHSLTIAAFSQDTPIGTPVRVQVAALRRPGPDTLPPQVKAVANYQLSRLARLSARAAGMDDAIFLNHEGRLAESAGAALLVERDGVVITPPAWDGALPSITVDVLARIAGETGIPFIREPIPLATARAADGIALAGTLDQLVDVVALDGTEVPRGPSIARLRTHYLDAITGSPLSGLLEFAEYRPGEGGLERAA